MDLAQIKQKLNAMNAGNSTSSDFDKNFWKPQEGKSVIRIVPSKFNKDNPFTEILFHSVKGMFKFPIPTLTNFGKQDPIEDFRQQLQSLGGRDNWSMSGKLTPRARWVVPVIVRGEEDKGVRLWSIGQTMCKALYTLAADEEIGDYTDIVKGTDMIVEKTMPTTPGAFPEISIRAKRTSSPLSEDAKQVELWLNEQPEPLKCFKEYSYDFIKSGLQAYLSGAVTNAFSEKVAAPAVVKEEEAVPVEKNIKKTVQPKAAAVKPTVQSTVSKFDDLFGEDADVSEDTLPF